MTAVTTWTTATGDDILAWARDGDDAAGFSSLGTIGGVIYGNHESIPTLAAAAAVSSRARPATTVLIAPFRGNGTLLAKQLATVDSLSASRLTVGLAVGGREDDYTGEKRGTAGAVGPTPRQQDGPPLLVGDTRPRAVRRVVSEGAGWISGGGAPDMFVQGAAPVRAAWQEAGPPRAPRLVARWPTTPSARPPPSSRRAFSRTSTPPWASTRPRRCPVT